MARTGRAVVAVLALLLGAAPARGAIVSRGPASSVAYASESTTAINLAAPAGAQPGDVLVASLGYGSSSAKTQPTLTPPTGWTLVSRVTHDPVAALVTYTHVYAAGEAAYTWKTSVPVGGVSFVTAYGGVDPTKPVDVFHTRSMGGGANVAAPSVKTTAPSEALQASYYGFRNKGGGTTWRPAAGMAELGDAVNSSGSRSASTAWTIQAAAGDSKDKVATASLSQDYSLSTLLALRVAPSAPPPPPPPSGAVPTIVDTDIFSDAGDVGALASAFALQSKNEAKVIAIGVNTRLSRPAVSANSWRCAAAVAQFYGAGDVPIGSDMPDDGTETNTDEFVTPCAQLAAPGTPAPQPAVDVFRRALASQADGSVVIVEVGYLENLAALLASGPDSISSLSGRDLVARKVRTLVIMGGGYPSRPGENNLEGNPGAAQAVASGWPTKVVWSGYEVGDQIHTGQTISSVHPANSPVRVAYEAFVGPNNWIYSYDLTAIYHAIRPSDPLLTEVGPGQNTVDSSGGNVFTLGAGNQYYLKLGSATGLDSAIETLLDTLPAAPPAPGPSDAFDTNAIDPAQWTVASTGSTVADANQELEITHPGGAWTSGGLQSAQPYDLTGRATDVQLLRPANGGQGGSTYGETSVFVSADSTHYAEFFVAGNSLTAWVNTGSGETNLTPTWPTYRPADQQWLRYREAGGTLYWEYAASSSGPWTVLASTPDPFATSSVRFRITAGANTATADTARFDNVFTTP